jgi:hypothetical protein
LDGQLGGQKGNQARIRVGVQAKRFSLMHTDSCWKGLIPATSAVVHTHSGLPKSSALRLGGDLAAVREITDRTEGRCRQNVETNPIDLSRLTPEQRLQLAKLLALANGSVETAESATDTPSQP